MNNEEVLFGTEKLERIVAVEMRGAEALYYIRHSDDTVSTMTEPTSYFLVTTNPFSLEGGELTLLDGDNDFRYLYSFNSFFDYREAKLKIRLMQGEYYTHHHAAKTILIRSGQTLFKGMDFNSIKRMTFDIESEGLDPTIHKTLMIVVRDNRGFEEVIMGDEPYILQRFVEIITIGNPDTLEGHNIFHFDLPFLMERAKRCNLFLSIGRDASEPRLLGERNFAIGERKKRIVPVHVYGRHCLDTYLAVQRFDVAKGQLTSHGLKNVCQQLGLAPEGRVYLDASEMKRLFKEDREKVITYARQDVEEAKALADLTLSTAFYLTQMVPDSFQNVALSGTGEMINSLFVRAYLSQGMSFPSPQLPRPYPGAYTEVRMQGLIERVVKADVESLYPSIMLNFNVKPEKDTLNICLPALKELTNRRLDAKRKLKTCRKGEREYWDGLQNSFKIFINSFYGYMGAGRMNFNDFNSAAMVTEKGREIVIRIAKELETREAQVIEIDTDGVFFVPPVSIQTEEEELDFIKEIGRCLPKGINLAFDGRYKLMGSLKTKNYVLFGYDGKRTYKGVSLRSRRDEAFGREFLEFVLSALENGERGSISPYYKSLFKEITSGNILIERLVQRQRLTEKIEEEDNTSLAKLKEAIKGRYGEGETVDWYVKPDGSYGLVEDYTEAEGYHIQHYIQKLYKFAERLKPLFGADFGWIFEAPVKRKDIARRGVKVVVPALPSELYGNLFETEEQWK